MRTEGAIRPAFTTSVGTPSKATARAARDVLGRHLASCTACKTQWFRLRCAIEAIDRFATPRFVTTAVVFAATLGLLCALT